MIISEISNMRQELSKLEELVDRAMAMATGGSLPHQTSKSSTSQANSAKTNLPSQPKTPYSLSHNPLASSKKTSPPSQPNPSSTSFPDSSTDTTNQPPPRRNPIIDFATKIPDDPSSNSFPPSSTNTTNQPPPRRNPIIDFVTKITHGFFAESSNEDIILFKIFAAVFSFILMMFDSRVRIIFHSVFSIIFDVFNTAFALISMIIDSQVRIIFYSIFSIILDAVRIVELFGLLFAIFWVSPLPAWLRRDVKEALMVAVGVEEKKSNEKLA